MSDINKDVYPLLQQMRHVFDELFSLVKEDEEKFRTAFTDLQKERDEMKRELLYWRQECQQWREEMFQLKERNERETLTLSSNRAVSQNAYPLPPHYIPRRSPERDELTDIAESAVSLQLEENTSTRDGMDERRRVVESDKGSVGSAPSNEIPEGYSRVLHALPKRSAQTSDYRVEQESVLRSEHRVTRGTDTTAHYSYPASFWIQVWPAFGNSAPLRVKPVKVFVYSYYKYIEDITEKAAKALCCQPAPSYLYEPDGTVVDAIHQLVPNQHYIIFPSGGFYRPEAVPIQLLRDLVNQSKRVLSHSAPRE